MQTKHAAALVLTVASSLVAGLTLSAPQDRYALKAPTGLAFSEFKGYEQWQMIGLSVSESGVGCGTSPDPGCTKAILGNPAMIKSYADGKPFNGKAVPDGAAFAKIEWSKERDSSAGYPMTVPGRLAEVGFMVKDSKRFPKTDGWGYAAFQYDTAADHWKVKGDGPEIANACHACHTILKSNDFVFSHYPKR